MLDGMATPWDRLGARIKRLRAEESQVPDELGYLAGERIRKIRDLALAVEQELDKEIVRARDQGASWSRLGDYLGMSKQGAQHRWRIAMTRTGGAVNPGWHARTMRDLVVKQD